MKRIEQDINQIQEAAVTLEKLAVAEKEDFRSVYLLQDSQRLRDKILAIQGNLNRAEYSLLQVPIVHKLGQ